jgi:diguanylate cyclase (GGDEF)-like protein
VLKVTFGVLFSNVDNVSQMRMWRGINDFAATHNISVVSFMNTFQSGQDDLAVHTNTIFDAIYNSTYLDGMVLFSGYVSHMVGGDDVYLSYVKKIPPHIPCVSIAQAIEGMPCISADNVGGIYNAVDHLIKAHGKRQIAFIRGPENHQEADERLLGYKKALEDNGIPFDPQYVLPGNFSHDGAIRAMSELLDVRQIPFDAVAASDDISALQAIRELTLRGGRVPADIAVTGFDNSTEAANSVPSLTTSGQDFYAMGNAAARTLFNIKSHGEYQDITYVPSPLHVRQSCGCFKRNFDFSGLLSAHGESDGFISFVMEVLLPIFPRQVSLGRWQNWIGTLAAFINENPFRKVDFLEAMDAILVDFSHRLKNYTVWDEVLKTFMIAAHRFKDEIDDTYAVMETLLYATTLLSEITANEAMVTEYNQNNARLTQRRVMSKLMSIFDIDKLAEDFHVALPEIDIQMALLGLYAQPVKSNSNDERLIQTLIGFDGETRFYVSDSTDNPMHFGDFSSMDVFDYNAKRRTLFFLPLFFKDEELGVLILPYSASGIYEMLRGHLSTAVKGAELINRIQALSVTDELTGLLNRRGFFQSVYARLNYLYRNPEAVPVVMFMDMDGLKMINDTHGHSEGDFALTRFADILRETLRRGDIIGRVGGDEFVVFSTVKAKETGDFAERRLRAKIHEYNARELHPYKIQCSIGSVVLEQATRDCFEEAMLSADTVLYDEKTRKRALGISRPK